MLDTIILENIRIYAHHGCLTEEGKIGSDYQVDLEVSANLEKSAKNDALKDTVDYVQLNRIVKEEMGKRSKLLEHAADRILIRIFKELEKVETASVKVSKINPPLGGDVEKVTIKLSKER